MSSNLRPVPVPTPTNEKSRKRRNPLIGYGLIGLVALTLIVLGTLRSLGLSDGEGVSLHSMTRGALFTLLTGGACMVAEITLHRLRKVAPLVKQRRVLRREQKALRRAYKKAMQAINKIVSQSEAWRNTKLILEGVYDRAWRQRVVYYFKKTNTAPFCACTLSCRNACACPICHEGPRS